ncbi:right-handed parallel beta-helix repeat-containing protein [Geminisphaera colitermitum]|uniref:right-handed parallel beta-helix repeat-containing protein n=1 Tax=Geminisphaera colitermitum TaxID=1148786 RepID=UPI000158C599|nr:right-handed parallel beta-helix repeat-containing protein [Geminisphaera colitermitum]
MRITPLIRRLVSASLAQLVLTSISFAALTSADIGLAGDGVTDDTAALQKALGEGSVEIVFAPGIYLLSTIDLPSRVTLRGEPGARIRINANRLSHYYTKASPQRPPNITDGGPATVGLRPSRTIPWAQWSNPRPLFAIRGDNVTLRDLEFDFTLIETLTTDEALPGALIMADGYSRLTFKGLVAERPEFAPPLPLEQRRSDRGISHGRHPTPPPGKHSFSLALLRNSQDIVLRDSRAAFMSSMVDLYQCSRVWVQRNRATDGSAITRSTQGDEFLHHTDNWSRNIVHQCRWWGGNANDNRTRSPESPGYGTAATVKRGSREADPDFDRFTPGAYDIVIANNQAEYGTTLAWGSKGRQVLFSGNIARFMTDYALGSEGGENVIFTGNTVINSYAAGLVAMYWSEKLVMTGNIVLVRDEPYEPQYLWRSKVEDYHGALIRLHTNPGNTVSGSGQTLITGNILSSELAGEPRRISIEGDRDVMLSSNKIRNGVIRTGHRNPGSVSIIGNEFTMTVSHTSHWLHLSPTLSRAIVRDNIFHNTRPLSARSPTEFLICAESNGGSDESFLRVIEGNQAIGFPLAVWARAHSRATPDRFIIRNNNLDGAIRLEGLDTSLHTLVTGNHDLATLAPLEPERLAQRPQRLPQPVASPEDRALDASANFQ